MNLDKIIRRVTKKIKIGDIYIGGDSSVKIQSMTNTDTRDVEKTVEQIKKLESVGCDIIRVAVLDEEAARCISKIKERIHIPIVADIHFDYKLALLSIENGADKIRINPGNIGSVERVKKIVDLAKLKNVPIRVGVNSGSLEKEILDKYGSVCVDALVESALKNVKILEDLDFQDIIVSIKSSNVLLTIDSYRELSKKTNYPMHLGVTEAGTKELGTIKSSVGIGALLSEGIGDTIRVSLTSDPIEEIYVAKEILKSLNIINGGIEFISCPTCGRCQMDLIKIANEVESKLKSIDKSIKVAVMGCAVNGPGEAKEADVGIAGGKDEALIFKKGKIVKKVSQDKVVEELMKEIETL